MGILSAIKNFLTAATDTTGWDNPTDRRHIVTATLAETEAVSKFHAVSALEEGKYKIHVETRGANKTISYYVAEGSRDRLFANIREVAEFFQDLKTDPRYMNVRVPPFWNAAGTTAELISPDGTIITAQRGRIALPKF